MQKVSIFCDVCGKTKPEDTGHWTNSWGPVIIDFSRIPALQHERYEYKDVCAKCGDKLVEDLKTSFNQLREGGIK